MLKKVFSNTLIYGLSPHVTKIASVMVMPLVTPFLTERDYGIFGLVMSYIAMLNVFMSLGLETLLANSFIKHPKLYINRWRMIYGFLIIWVVFYTLIQCLILYFLLPEDIENKILLLFLSTGASLFFGISTKIGTLYYQLKEKASQVAIRSVIIGFLGVGITYYCIAILKLGYMGWFYSMFIGGVLTNISYLIPLTFSLKITPLFNFKKKYIKSYLKISLPILPHYYSSYLLDSSNRLLMDKLGIPIHAIGRFNIAATFAGYGGMLGYALNTAFNPQIMRDIRNNDEETAKKMILIMQFVMFCFTFFCGLWMKEIIEFLIRIETDNMSQIYYMAIVLIFAYNYRPMYIASSNMFFYYEKTNRLVYISFVAGILSVVLNIIFLNFYGVFISAIVYFVATSYMGYIGFFMKEFKNNTKVKYPYVKVFLINLLLLIVVLCLVDCSILVKAILTLIIFFILKNKIELKKYLP